MQRSLRLWAGCCARCSSPLARFEPWLSSVVAKPSVRFVALSSTTGMLLSRPHTSLATRMIHSGASPTQPCINHVFLDGLCGATSWKGTMPLSERLHGGTARATIRKTTDTFPCSRGILSSSEALPQACKNRFASLRLCGKFIGSTAASVVKNEVSRTKTQK